MVFCCVCLSCYCEQYKVKTNFRGLVCGRWLDCCGTGQGHVGELLWMRQWMFRFHKMRWIYWVAEELLASEREFCNYSNEVFVGPTVGRCSLVCESLFVASVWTLIGRRPCTIAVYWPTTSAFPHQIVLQPVSLLLSAVCDILSSRNGPTGSPCAKFLTGSFSLSVSTGCPLWLWPL